MAVTNYKQVFRSGISPDSLTHPAAKDLSPPPSSCRRGRSVFVLCIFPPPGEVLKSVVGISFGVPTHRSGIGVVWKLFNSSNRRTVTTEAVITVIFGPCVSLDVK